MGLERRGRVKRSHDRGNWKQEDFDACDRQAVRLACLLDGSRMSREVQVRFYERPVVKFRRPTHPELSQTPEIQLSLPARPFSDWSVDFHDLTISSARHEQLAPL